MPSVIKSNLVAHQGTLDEIASVADNLMAYNYANNHTYDYPPSQPCHSNMSPSFHVNRNDKPIQYHYQYYASTSQNQVRIIYNASEIPNGIRSFHEKQKPKVCRFRLYYDKDAKKCKPWCILNNSSIPTLPNSRPNSRSSSPVRAWRSGKLYSQLVCSVVAELPLVIS